MRGNNRAWHGSQRITNQKRLVRIGHVEGTAQPPALYFCSESVQVDQATSGNVDDTSAIRKVRQIRPIQQAPVFFSQRSGQD